MDWDALNRPLRAVHWLDRRYLSFLVAIEGPYDGEDENSEKGTKKHEDGGKEPNKLLIIGSSVSWKG